MNTILIESNRLIAESQLQQGLDESSTITSSLHTTVENNASWSTNIDTGIELNVGDQISMEACALNINGAGSGNFQQFNGKVDVPDSNGLFRKDNAAELELAYYTSNNIEFNFPLPSGKHTINNNIVLGGNFGGPSLDGRSLWMPTYETKTGSTFETNTPPLPNLNSLNFYLTSEGAFNGPNTNRQDAGGYFFAGMDDAAFLVPGAGAAPAYAPALAPALTTALSSTAGYLAWCQSCCWLDLPGVQFGQSIGPLTPLTTSYPYPTTAPTQTTSQLNLNVETKDTFNNAGFFPDGTNGGANPLMCINAEIPSMPTAPVGPAGAQSNGSLPYNVADWNTNLPAAYSFKPQQDTSIYKGGHLNHDPNGRRLYQPKRDTTKSYCLGPFYDVKSNNLLESNWAASADPQMLGMVNLNDKTLDDEFQFVRSGGFWTFQTKKINVELETGNIAPSRISEILTETIKARHGQADYPEEEFFKQISFKPRPIEVRTNQPGELLETEEAAVSSKSYSTFPTLAGSCLSAAQNVSSNGLGDQFGWDVVTQDNINLQSGDTTTDISPGRNYNIVQAETQYWSNQLCGNPFEWRGVTKILPMIQYKPFTDTELATFGTGFDYTLWSCYTGVAGVDSDGLKYDTRAVPAPNPPVNVEIGAYGCMPCLMNTPSSGSSSNTDDRSHIGKWWLEVVTATDDTPPVTGPYKINSYPYGKWTGSTLGKEYKTLAPKPLEVLVTNIIFNGQVRPTIWNDLAEDIQGHNIGSGMDTLQSQSSEFFDNTYVEWKIGRLNDQQTYPEQYTDVDFNLYKKEEGQKGYAQYLPNLYQTNQGLYRGDPVSFSYDPGYSAGDINDILDNYTSGVVNSPQNTYNMMPQKIGAYALNGDYTDPNYNPQVYYTHDGTGYNTDNFGPPTWGTFRSEYTDNIENTTGFDKVCNRTIKAYRYLPQNQSEKYTVENAWNQNIKLHLGANWTTRPSTMSYSDFKVLWLSMTKLNNGKGLGMIPVFSKDPTKSVEYNNIPFTGIIYMGQDQKEMPLPVEGEFIMMGSTPSLTQNDLHLPASTQQSHDNEWKSTDAGIRDQTLTPDPKKPPTAQQVLDLRQNSFPSNWATSKYVGANDPVFTYDDTFNRYTYSKFHTSYFSGNGRFQYGNSGPSQNPQTQELLIKGQTAAFSKQLTLPNGYIYYLTNGGAWNTSVQAEYAELIEGNVISDRINPGGWTSGVNPVGVTNPQYGSPTGGTQYELRLMNVPGNQIILPFPEYSPANRNAPDPTGAYFNFTLPGSVRPYAYIKSAVQPYPTISTQSGIGVVGLGIPNTNGNITPLSSSDFARFKGTLFDKMGFQLGQFLPLYGKVQTHLNHTLFNKFTGPDKPAGLAYHNLLYPITTQADITSSSTPALCNLFGISPEDIPITSPQNLPMPSYNLGMLIPPGSTNATSESMFAISLPAKLNFPYLVLRSNIQTPCAIQYVGGTNGQQPLPAISYLMTNYATNDFFYNNRSDLVFTVNRPYILTEIRSSIHLPNGELADKILDENSAVIYRIDFAKKVTDKQEDAVAKVLNSV